jgi:spermidine synthase
VLELRRRGARDFLIVLDGRVIMSSAAHRSEVALAQLACRPIAGRTAPRVLVGGLGMGFTLRAALDALPPGARVVVAELHAAVLAWCSGPLAFLSADAPRDPRVRVVLGDVADAIRDGARTPYDAIALDLYEGPQPPRRGDRHFGPAALARARAALAPGGALAVWAEGRVPGFERAFARAGFEVTAHRPGRGGLRHAVIVGVRGPDTPGGRPRGPAARRRS